MFDSADTLPVTSPIVSFTGPIIGPGHTLLHPDTISDLEDTQAKCCGFIQLSTFLTPGDPTKTPFKGFHPFQVFVIFPIHVNPWSSLCKRMITLQENDWETGNPLPIEYLIFLYRKGSGFPRSPYHDQPTAAYTRLCLHRRAGHLAIPPQGKPRFHLHIALSHHSS